MKIKGWLNSSYRIGIAAVAFCLLLAAGVIWISTATFGQTTFSAHLEQTAGLLSGEDVTIAGVVVGKVKSIQLDGSDVLVKFTVDSSHRLGSATTASVRVATLLGTHYLALDPQGSGTLADDTVPLSQTSVPFNLQDVINKGTGAVEGLNGPLIAQALSDAADVTEAVNGNIRPALDGIARMSKVVSVRTQQAGELLNAAQSVTKQLNSSSSNIFSLMQQSTLVLNAITARRAEIHTLITATVQLARSLSSILHRIPKPLARALANTNKVLVMLKSQDATLKQALTEIAPVARYVANATGNGPWATINLPNFAPDPLVCKAKGTC